MTRGIVAEMRRIGVTPHAVQNSGRTGGSAIDGRTTLPLLSMPSRHQICNFKQSS